MKGYNATLIICNIINTFNLDRSNDRRYRKNDLNKSSSNKHKTHSCNKHKHLKSI